MQRFRVLRSLKVMHVTLLPGLVIGCLCPHCMLSSPFSAIGWAQMAAAHGGKLPLPLQLPGERGLLLSCIVCLGDKVWISLFSPSHFDLTPIQDSWYCRWTWHSTAASVELWNGKRRMGLRGMGLKASVSAVLCARQTQWPSWLNSAEKVTARTEQEKSPEGK